MEMLLVLTYVSICWCIFKFLKVPVNQWTLTTAALIGFLGIAFIIVMMNISHPASKIARFYFPTTPVVPQVRGRVVEVPVKANVPLKAGDVLFRVDAKIYEDRVKQVEAKLKISQRRLADAQRLNKKGVGPLRDVLNNQADVDELTARLSETNFDLAQTVVRAPTNGFVTQLILRPGMMAVPLPLAPVMVFVHEEQKHFIAAMDQNPLQGIERGNEVEIAFPAIPGRVFKGEVDYILPVMAEGQLSTSGKLISATRPTPPGRVPIVIKITDDLSKFTLPGGSSATVAIYTNNWTHFAMIRRVLLRMESWGNYVFGH